jgi:hypothetical protein
MLTIWIFAGHEMHVSKPALPAEDTRSQVDTIVAQVRRNEIHLVFDGVDEMARPYTSGGRKEAIQILARVGNGAATPTSSEVQILPKTTTCLCTSALWQAIIRERRPSAGQVSCPILPAARSCSRYPAGALGYTILLGRPSCGYSRTTLCRSFLPLTYPGLRIPRKSNGCHPIPSGISGTALPASLGPPVDVR